MINLNSIASGFLSGNRTRDHRHTQPSRFGIRRHPSEYFRRHQFAWLVYPGSAAARHGAVPAWQRGKHFPPARFSADVSSSGLQHTDLRLSWLWEQRRHTHRAGYLSGCRDRMALPDRTTAHPPPAVSCCSANRWAALLPHGWPPAKNRLHW